MAQYQTPGVYIVEKNAFPNSVVEVATAVPVFIGYTERARYSGQSFLKTPVKLNSMIDYGAYFGKAPVTTVGLTEQKTASKEFLSLNGKYYSIDVKNGLFYLYNSLRFFYQNGGGTCYVISIGDYSSKPAKDDFVAALDLLKNEQNPTMILMPDSLLLDKANYYTGAVAEMLSHCQDSQNRIALLDVYGGNVTDPLKIDDPIKDFRNGVPNKALNYGAAYFPWLNSTVIQQNEITFQNIDGDLATLLEQGNAAVTTILQTINTLKKAGAAANPDEVTQAHNAMLSASVNYTHIINGILAKLNVLPAAPAMAGVYTYVDQTRGVWKAPANVGLSSVTAPTVNLNDVQQQNLNVDAVSGKSINAIRFFTGQGVLPWGARTLDGNSQDWKYVSVRRTMIMIEQSVKLAARSYVFEPNDANTWAAVKSMIGNFLNDVWKQGGLVGAKPEDAFSVQVGLGSTMTAEDILNGIMNITVLVAVSRPAEFIVITFQQQMQKS